MNKRNLIIVASLLTFLLLSSVETFAQEGDVAFRMRLETILTNFKNYRFSEVSVYRVKDMKDIRTVIKAKEDAMIGGGEQGTDECVKNADKAVTNFVENATREGASINQVRRDMLGRGMSIPDDLDCIFNYYNSRVLGAIKQLRNAYAVTTRMRPGQIEPNVIIGLIVTTEDESYVDKNIGTVSASNVYTYPELKEFEIKDKDIRANNLYELVLNAFRQANVENKTLEAQGIGTDLLFAPKKYGVSNSLFAKKYDISSTDVQKFLQVSEGQPNEMKIVKNEVIVSPDLIRYLRYNLDVVSDEYGTDTLSFITNNNLPKYGAELRYGIDGIGYPSLWSERMTLSALWQSTKLGLILPTSGWSGIAKDAFELQRKLTYGGLGISSSIDFPVLLMPASGLFHLNIGYIFGDAKPADYKNRNTNPDEYQYITGDDDYMIRANATMLYTFGISIDEDYILRFGLGGTIYTAEKWHYNVEENEFRENELVYKNESSETVGGITAKIDFMAKKMTTPFGGSLQYFDEGLYTNLWLQIPVVDNSIYVRLDAKGYFKAFAESPRPWENESVFIPMARIILNF